MAKQLKATQVADATSLAATTSYAFTADSHKVVSVQAVWTATTASFSAALQYSNDGVTWKDFTTATTITNSNGDVMWDVVGTKDAVYWQVKATRTSGTLTTFKAYVANEPRT